jgi:hypothetical protein
MKNRVIWRALLVIVLIFIALFVAAFFRMGTNDTRSIEGFSAAYQQYDRLVAEYSAQVLAPESNAASESRELASAVDGALVALNTAASARISSLTKNDGTIMHVTREIAGYSAQEVETLKSVQALPSGAGMLAEQARALRGKRQADYARFQELAGITD